MYDKVALVKFKDYHSQTYSYGIPKHLEAEAVEGARAVVPSPIGYAVVEIEGVVAYLDSPWQGSHKPVIDIVDDVWYITSKDRAKKRERILRELEIAAAEADRVALYEQLAEADPKVSALLDELRRLDGREEAVPAG